MSIQFIEYNNTLDSIQPIIQAIQQQQSFIVLHYSWPDQYKQSIKTILQKLENTHISSTEAHPSHTPTAIFASSGTTGIPKLICHHINSLIKSAKRSLNNNPIQPNENIILSISPAHMGGMLSVVKSMVSGATLHVHKDWLEQSLTIPNKHYAVVPTQLEKILLTFNNNANIQSILVGGDKTPYKLKQDSQKLPIIYSYGSTETCGQITATPKQHTQTDILNHSGTALNGVHITLENNQIAILTNTLAYGTIQANGHTIQPLVHTTNKQGPSNPEAPYISNDIGNINNQNNVTIIGRKDWQFKSGGSLIQPEAIETTLCQHPNIAHAIIVPTKDPTYGYVPKAFVSTTLSTAELTAYSKTQLPKYMQPKQWVTWPETIAADTKTTRKDLIASGQSHDHKKTI
jgi:o-succinylbenzoate---CoA ligase